jgi:hypothetical protein
MLLPGHRSFEDAFGWTNANVTAHKVALPVTASTRPRVRPLPPRASARRGDEGEHRVQTVEAAEAVGDVRGPGLGA